MKHILELNELSNELTLVDFYATWCGPCKMLAPVLEEVTGAEVVKVDVDQASDLAREFKISAVPTMILFKEKKEIARRAGYATLEDIEKWIEENK